MRKLILFISFITISLGYSSSSLALSNFGHKVVCQLAFEHLSQGKKVRLSQLLNAVPREQQKIINRFNNINQDSQLTFANACTWADAVKNTAEFKQYKTWHYINVPRSLAKINKPICSKNCIPQAIITHQKQLKNSPRSWQSAQALFLLGHWLGDIHQPLHVSYASDLGGNKISLVNTKSRCKNLHSYWDSCLIKTAKRSQKQWVSRLNSKWADISIPYFYSQDVWKWANESYQIVRQHAFKYCHLTNKNECLKPTEDLTLTIDYARHYLPVMETQLLKAAKRLTGILEVSL